MKIFITGGEGFIGSWIVEKLSKSGHQVTTLDNHDTYGVIGGYDLELLCGWRQRNWKETKKFGGDVTTPRSYYELIPENALAALEESDVVIHLASFPRAKIVNEDPQTGVNNIVGGTTNMLDFCKNTKVKRFVFVSSSMIYGHFKDGTKENASAKPINVYGEAKLAAEKMTELYSRVYGLEYVIARPSGVYGPGDIPDRVLSKFFEAAMNNRDINVHDANNKVDFTYVEDTADGIIRCALEKKAANNIFNITAGGATSLGEAAAKIIKLTGSQSRIKDTGQNNLYPERGTLDIAQAKKLLKYKPQHSFDQGIKKYYEWLQNKI
jgi:nucleoside-diphosphate-sugar epimerase